MTWLDTVLAQHSECALDSEDDREALARHIIAAFPDEPLVANLFASLLTVLRVELAGDVRVAMLAELLTRNAVQTTIAILLGTNPSPVTAEDLALARRAGSVAAARIYAHEVDRECDRLRAEIESARAEIALLRERQRAFDAAAIVPKKVISS